MSNIVSVVSTILKGASDDEVKKLADAAINEMLSRGIKLMSVLSKTEAPSKTKRSGKSNGPFWVKTVEGYDYTAKKQSNYQLTGEWVDGSVDGIKDLEEGTRVIIGRKSKSDKMFWFGVVMNEHRATLKDWHNENVLVEGFSEVVSSASYGHIVDSFKAYDIPQHDAA